jgi:MoxR-like ATPase
MQYEIQALNERVERESRFVPILQKSIQRVIVGQKYLVDRLLIGILCDGHVLIEGVSVWPRRFRENTGGVGRHRLRRIRFTPDLCPPRSGRVLTARPHLHG